MKTVDQLLDAVKARHKIGSDYKLAQYLGMTDSAIRNYRHKRSLPDEVACVKIAQALDLDGDVLAAQIQSQRARDVETKAFWSRLAVRLEAGAVHAALMLVIAIGSIAGYAPNAEATALSPASSGVQSVYYVKLLGASPVRSGAFAPIRRRENVPYCEGKMSDEGHHVPPSKSASINSRSLIQL